MASPEHRVTARPVRNLTVLTRKPANHVLASATRAGYDVAGYDIDGIVDFAFDSHQGVHRVWSSEASAEIMGDAPSFVDRLCIHDVREHVFIDREARR